MNDDRPNASTPLPWPLLVALAWVLPGLGHGLAGYRLRGIVVGVTLMTLFLAGLLVGGVSVVDARHHRIWYSGQILLGPTAIVTNVIHQKLRQAQDRRIAQFAAETGRAAESDSARRELLQRSDGPIYIQAVGRVHELGMLYCTLAGVMNLLVMLDLVGRLNNGPEDAPHETVASGLGRVVNREAAP